MHLDIGLPLLSELEQLCRAFWQNYNHQNHSHNQGTAINSQNHTPCSQPQRQRPNHKQCWDNANNHTEPNHLSLSQDQNSAPDSYLDGEQHTHDNHDMRTEQDHSSLSEECKNHSQNKSLNCRSTSTDLDKNGSETYEHNNSSGHEPSQPLQVNNSVLDQCNRPKKTSRVQWNKSTDDSSFLWLLNFTKTTHIYKALFWKIKHLTGTELEPSLSYMWRTNA